jgi:DNA-binding beta-propeller fold protein YncE
LFIVLHAALMTLPLFSSAVYSSPTAPLIIVGTTDFTSGSLATIVPGGATAAVNLLNIHSDAVVTTYGGKVYVINRLGQDNIIVLDPANPRSPLLQFSVGNGSNPQDIAFVSPTKAYVSRYGRPDLWIVNPQTGEQIGAIDLSPFADADGIPEMAGMAVVGTRLYVTCQRLDQNAGFVPTEKSLLIAIDTITDRVVDMDPQTEGVQAISLAATNPVSLRLFKRKLYVSLVSRFGDMEGGIEVIDGTTGKSEGLKISEQAFGGDLNTIAMLSETRGYAIISDATFTNFVKPFDLSTGTVSAPLPDHSGGFTPDIVVAAGWLYVADRGTFQAPERAGILVYDTATNTKVQGPISTGLPPFSITIIGGEQPTAVEEGEISMEPKVFTLGPAYPNPFNPFTILPFAIPAGLGESGRLVPIHLAIYNTSGQQIRTLLRDSRPAGIYVTSWDGQDDQGKLVPSGVYIAHLSAGGYTRTVKLALIK